MRQIDTRLVQTAVMGGRDSDRPVILPEEPHNLDEFRRQYGTDRFWCGTLLGGCGEKLMTKRYETKVCHFSHYPDRTGTVAPCHRTSNGVDSADHLFIKQHVKEWLIGQGHAAQADLRSLGTGPGDAVDFWLRATGQHLRFELRPEDYRRWRKAAESLGAREGHVEWVFGPEGAITRDMVARQGYALRVRCETSGNDRRVLIGTVTADSAVSWTPLDTCRLTTDGIVTPALDELRAAKKIRSGGMRNSPLPASLSLQGAQLVFAVDTETDAPADSPLAADGRLLYAGYLKPSGSRIARALLSLPNDVPPPAEDYVYQLTGMVRLLLTDPIGTSDTSWAVRSDGIHRLNGLDAERTGLWRPSVALGAPEHAPRRQDAVAPKHVRDEPPAQPKRSRQAAVLRKALERVATQQTTTTWQQLAREHGLSLANLSDSARRNLLLEADRPVPAGAVPLCVLVLAPGARRALPYLSTTLRQLGVVAPASDAALQRWSADAIRRVHATYGKHVAVSVDSPRAADTGPAKPPSPVELGAANRHVQALRSKLAEATSIRSRATGRRAARLATAIPRADDHVKGFAEARTEARALRQWIQTGDRLLDELDRLVGRPVEAPDSATTRPTAPIPPTSTTAARTDPPGGSPATPRATRNLTERTPQDLPRIAELFAEAKASGDLTSATRLKRETDALREARLSFQAKLQLRALKNEMREWIRNHEAREAQESLRTVFETLPQPGASEEQAKLRSALAHAKILKRRCPGPLPNDLSDEFDALTQRLSAVSGHATQGGQKAAPSGPPAEQDGAHSEARAEFDWLVDEMRTAQQTGDLASVEAARRLAGPVYGLRLSPEDRETFTPFMKEVKAWCQNHANRSETDPSLKQIRRMLARLDEARATATTTDIRDVLAAIQELREALTDPLPSVEETRLRRWRSRLKHQKAKSQPFTKPASALAAVDLPRAKKNPSLPGPDRLTRAAIDRLADPVRAVLVDTARAGGSVLTWGALRARMQETLPHLHPDDQGELLVAVDYRTPHDEPLLTTLIASVDASQHWLYPHVRHSLGRPRIPDDELEVHWAQEILRLRQTWRHR
ncbi:hypothetical protein ABZT45_32285 [Streptomyces sp. NPDC005356]|uniref:hypothetical protein n=1 Tax=Streptomyces sp. NPDC005356 TaxID=3157167 RepID=UPI0033B255DD